MQPRTFVIIGLALLVIVAGGFLLIASGGSTPGAVQTVSEKELVSPNSHIRGKVDAPLTLVEFSDFQCPACGYEAPVIEKVLSQYPDALRFVYRHFPLPQHQYGTIAARAAEAAALQGKFWEMHDKLFANQEKLTEGDISKYASDIGLDQKKFQEDWKSDVTAQRVGEDKAAAEQLKINSTPTLYLNGQKISSPISEAQLKAEVEKVLKK